mmetsp:Transcript_6297/g.17627  ORF Transcript_6297/g.17627 Transcript_6297/m.17627 type:complete len:240 (-) Transcript_6297:1404-2123(-)
MTWSRTTCIGTDTAGGLSTSSCALSWWSMASRMVSSMWRALPASIWRPSMSSRAIDSGVSFSVSKGNSSSKFVPSSVTMRMASVCVDPATRRVSCKNCSMVSLCSVRSSVMDVCRTNPNLPSDRARRWPLPCLGPVGAVTGASLCRVCSVGESSICTMASAASTSWSRLGTIILGAGAGAGGATVSAAPAVAASSAAPVSPAVSLATPAFALSPCREGGVSSSAAEAGDASEAGVTRSV